MYILRLKQLGQTMEQGLFVNWLKGKNETFAVGDEIYEIETDKATLAVEAAREGRIVATIVQPDDMIAIGGALAIVAEDGENPSADEISALLAEAGSASA
ncbi:MAG TPA: biotin/lipoyl-containing protein [Rhizomicrobium sp.]|nr:biotin/lipoyl-containing protein [Rhizomicrobium sp.]